MLFGINNFFLYYWMCLPIDLNVFWPINIESYLTTQNVTKNSVFVTSTCIWMTCVRIKWIAVGVFCSYSIILLYKAHILDFFLDKKNVNFKGTWTRFEIIFFILFFMYKTIYWCILNDRLKYWIKVKLQARYIC